MKTSTRNLLVVLLSPSLAGSLFACGEDVVIFAGPAEYDPRDATPLPPPPNGDAMPGDSGRDGGGLVDGGQDADVDAQSDADVDAEADAEIDGGGPDESPLVAQFMADIVEAFCTGYETCCANEERDPTQPTCRDAAVVVPGTASSFLNGVRDAYFYNSSIPTNGRLRFDPVRGAACLAALSSYCPNSVPADQAQLVEDCFLAAYGRGVANDPCFSDIECGRELFCSGAPIHGSDGSATPGTCRRLALPGEAHESTGPYAGSSCSYRGAGSNGLRIAPDGRCLPDVEPNGADCVLDYDCASYACSLVEVDGQEAQQCAPLKSDAYHCYAYSAP